MNIFGFSIVTGSTQGYKIVVNVNETGNSSSINLNVDVPLNNKTTSSVIEFNVGIDYIDYPNTNCSLTINNYHLLFGVDGENFYQNLSSGVNSWEIFCNSATTASASGNFSIFNFSIDDINEFYFNDDDIGGIVNYQGANNLTNLTLNGELIDIFNGKFTINSSMISTPGEYELIATTMYYGELVSISKNFSVGKITVDFESNVDENTDINFTINVENVIGVTYDLYIDNINIASTYNNQTISRSFNNGNYIVWLKNIKNSGKSYNDINFGNLVVNTVNDGVDREKPNLDLIYPSDGDVITETTIEFRFKVEDNVDIEWCDFNLYNATSDASMINSNYLVYNETKNDFSDSSETVKIKIKDFDERDYNWEIVCSDSAGNEKSYYNYFKINLSSTNYVREITNNANNYTREDEVNELIDDINTFLKEESNLGIEERKALEILDIKDDMTFYKKQLLQMDQDLKYNLKWMDETKRDKRISEIDEEIDKIRKNIVLKISVDDSYEYSKSSLDVPVLEIISNYFLATNHNIKNGVLKRLSRYNEELQHKLSTRVETLKLNIDYIDETREMILVNKQLSIDNDFDGNILEVINEDMPENITFVTAAKDIGNNIWEINPNDLVNGEIVYYFYDDLPLQKIEKTESLLFDEDGSLDTNIMTGFVIGIKDELSFSLFSFLIGFLFLGYVGFFLFGKAKIEIWKKDPAVMNILNLIEKAKLQLRQNEIENARENYCRMGETYRLLPDKSKMFFFNEIKMVRLAIDKKDVLNLVREYEKAKLENRKEDTIQLHEKISEIYKKLPKKFQDKVYQRLVKNEVK